MKGVAVAVLLACASAWADDVPRRVVLEVRSAALVQADGSTATVGPGVYMPEADAIAAGREVVDLRARVASLEASVGPSGSTAAIIAGAIVLALGAGYAAGRLVK